MENRNNNGYGKIYNNNIRSNNENSAASEVVASTTVSATNKSFADSAKSFVTSKWGIAAGVAALVVSSGAAYLYFKNKKKKSNKQADIPEEGKKNE